MDWGMVGILIIMLLPMLAGGVTFYYSVIVSESTRED